VLNLEPRQVALLSVDGQLRSAYLDGRHVLSVDAADTDSDGAMLHFVHIESVLQVPWTQHLPVAPAAPGEPTSRLANGVFEVVISDPVRFHRAFLRDGEGQCETDCVEALSHLLPTFLTIHLARVCGAKADMETQRTALKQLDPAHLDAVLTPYGVRCTAIRIHEGFGGLPLVDKAGDLPAEDRCDALPIDCRAC